MTITAIDVDFDSSATESGAQDETATSLVILSSSTTSLNRRVQLRVSLVGLSGTVSDVDIQGLVTSETIEAGEVVAVKLYNDTGDDDPDADDGATKYARSINGTTHATLVVEGSGTTSADLGATVDAAVENNLGGFVSFAFAPDTADPWDNNETAAFESIENAGTDPVTLTVDWTAAATTWVPRNVAVKQAVQRATVR